MTTSTRIRSFAARIVFLVLGVAVPFAAFGESQVIERKVDSKNFANNKIGVNPVRKMAIYLPSGYSESSKRYRVIYFLTAPWGSYRAVFDENGAQVLFDRAIAGGRISAFIFVC